MRGGKYEEYDHDDDKQKDKMRECDRIKLNMKNVECGGTGEGNINKGSGFKHSGFSIAIRRERMS